MSVRDQPEPHMRVSLNPREFNLEPVRALSGPQLSSERMLPLPLTPLSWQPPLEQQDTGLLRTTFPASWGTRAHPGVVYTSQSSVWPNVRATLHVRLHLFSENRPALDCATLPKDSPEQLNHGSR